MVAAVLLEGGGGVAAAGGNSKNNHSNNNNIAKKLDDIMLPAIQWACEPFLETQQYNKLEQQLQQQHQLNNLNPVIEKTREFCLKLRGGKLGGKGDNSDVAIIDDVSNAEGSIDNGNSSTDSSVAVLENEKDNDESSSTANNTETTETNTTMDSNDESYNNNTTEDEQSKEQELELSSSAEEEEKEQNDDDDEQPTSSSLEKYTFSVFQENDGHETDPDGIPARYLKMQNDRRDLAKAAVEKTVQWRKENDIDTMLGRPHPKYDVAKAVFPHYFCGRDDTQHVILLQRPGLMNVKLATKNNVSGEDLLFHYIYVMEYLWRIVDPKPDATMTSIIDLTEMNISILRKREQLRIGSLFLSTMDAHFPQRSHRTFLINAPKWFGALYKIASPLLRESTKEKIQILSKGKEQDEVLQHLLQDCPIPEGTKYEDVPAGVMEEELRNFCLARLEDAGGTMQPVEYV